MAMPAKAEGEVFRVTTAKPQDPLTLLTKHVHIAHVGRHTVFLDLQNDQYLCVHTERLQSIVNSPRDAESPNDPLYEELVQRQLLTQEASEGKAIAPAGAPKPVRDLPPAYGPAVIRSSPWMILRMLKYGYGADRLLKRADLSSAITQLLEKKRQIMAKKDLTTNHSEAWLRSALRARYYYPADRICLRDSHMLMHVLLDHGIDATWVYGVTTDPFSAHCWVQIGDLVVNDTAEQAQRYTPIMVI
jgi:hypothetical protein